MSKFVYPIEILHLFVSPDHNYFGHDRSGAPGSHPTEDRAEIDLIVGKGIIGDRFFDVKADFDGQVTFFSSEALPQGDYEALRRNIVTRGVSVIELIGQEFEIRRPNGELIRFRGIKHCAPCVWLDKTLGSGTQQQLRGRGGLRAQVLSDGLLVKGKLELLSPIRLDIENPEKSIPRPALP